MSPALLPGDRVVVDTDERTLLSRGEIVAVAFGNSVPIVKRIVAVPGDTVEFRENAVWVNGRRARDFDISRWRSTVRQLERYGATVPDGYYFILGDNPENSRDSGRLGLISFAHLRGKVIRVLKASLHLHGDRARIANCGQSTFI
jgi:signal peptidase I